MNIVIFLNEFRNNTVHFSSNLDDLAPIVEAISTFQSFSLGPYSTWFYFFVLLTHTYFVVSLNKAMHLTHLGLFYKSDGAK